MLKFLGQRFLKIMESSGDFSWFVLHIFQSLFRRPFEWRQLSRQLEAVGVASFPVVTVTCVFTGMVFTLQTFDGFARFQAEAYVPGVLGVALLRELGPVLGGMMLAGRVGSAMAAELGTMRVTDQIDALEVMATDPIQYLVVPRFLATALMFPLLVALGDYIGLLAGSFMVNQILNHPMPGFMDRVFEFLEAFDFWSGLIKAVVFGGIIAAVGCYHGLHTRGGAAGVGRSTTSAVVNASLGILVSDFFLSKVMN